MLCGVLFDYLVDEWCDVCCYCLFEIVVFVVVDIDDDGWFDW